MSVVGCMGVESSGEGAGETSLGGSASSGVDDSGCSPSVAGDIPSGASGFPVG